MKPLMEGGVLRGDPNIALVSTAAAKELRDCYFAPMVSKFVGLVSDDSRTLRYARPGF